MKALVTGGSGFVGGHLIRRLVSEGWEVAGLARSAASADRVESLGARAVSGSLGHLPEMTEGMKAADVVFHCAAWVGTWGDPNQIRATNVQGTANVIAGARNAGVPKLVHVSTESVLIDGRPLSNVDETEPIPSGGHLSVYASTKAEAETLVTSANGEGLETVSVRPRFIWGPGDTALLPALKEKVERGLFTWADQGRHLQSTTHVFNVVEGLMLAAKAGGGGDSYFVTDGPPWTVRDFMTAYLQTAGIEPPDRSIPGWLVRSAASAAESVWKLMSVNSAPPLNRIEACFASREMVFNDSKARDELGYREMISLEDGMRRLREGDSPLAGRP